jgi:hypothetical protein
MSKLKTGAVARLASQIQADDAARKARAKAKRDAKRADEQIGLLMKMANDNYERDGGTMLETFGEQDFAREIAEHGTAAKAWAFHTRVVDAKRESQGANEADAELAAEREAAKREAEASAYREALIVDAKAMLGEDATAEAIAKYVAEQMQGPEKARYDGPMLALRKAAKHYVKGANGNPHCGDFLATALDGLTREQVVERLGKLLFAKGITTSVNPYTALNPGQQSMNLRNKARGAYLKGLLKDADLATLKAE